MIHQTRTESIKLDAFLFRGLANNMGMSDTIVFQGKCPFCEVETELRVKHKWGLVSDATQHIGDKIKWEDPENKLTWKTLYTGGMGPLKGSTLIVVGWISRCMKCIQLPHQGREVFIEIQDDSIVDIYWSVSLGKAHRIVETINRNPNFTIWTSGFQQKGASLAFLASFVPGLLTDFVNWLGDKKWANRDNYLWAIEVMIDELRDRERLQARIGSGSGSLGELRYSGTIQSFGLEKLQAQVARISDDSTDPLNIWARSLLRDFPESIPK